jgi:Glucose-6-phosphate 1-dehydrogenase
VVIEKPFGHSLDSARALNSQILRTLHEDQIFRIDHFLGKDTVQNIMAFRFANGIFEPMWNRDRIDHVQITAAETVGVEGRGSFYEATGALRDMVPNHLFTLLSMVTMEPPVGFDAGAIRSKKAELLAAIPEVQPSKAVRGQYGAGTVLGKRTNAYRQEPNVAPNSNVETYVALRLEIDNWRWAGCRSICGPANICRSGTLRSPSASSRPPTRPSKIRLWTLCVRIGWCCASLRTKESPCNSRSSAAAP